MDQLDPRRWLTRLELTRARAAFVRAVVAEPDSVERALSRRRREAVMTGVWLCATKDSGWQESTDVERQAAANRLNFVRWLRDQERLSDAC